MKNTTTKHMEKINKNESGVVYIAILENITYPLAVAKSLEELESKITDYFGSRGKIVAKHASKLKFPDSYQSLYECLEYNPFTQGMNKVFVKIYCFEL